MNPKSTSQVLAEATAAMVDSHDVTDLLTRLLRDGSSSLGVDAMGLIVQAPDDSLELLVSTSHGVAELEALQVGQDEGPCVECHRSAAPVVALGASVIQLRWPIAGEAIVRAGFAAVHAFPLVWHGRALGALNVFTRSDAALDDAQRVMAQAFTDMSTIVILQSQSVDQRRITESLREALLGRVVIEQAKGALAHLEGIDMATAYELLITEAEQRGAPVTQVAGDVLSRAQRQRTGR